MEAGAAPGSGSPVLTGAYLRLLLVCALMGLPVALLSTAYTSFTERAREALWTDLPTAAGWAEPPSWYVVALPVIGGLIVAGAGACRATGATRRSSPSISHPCRSPRCPGCCSPRARASPSG